MSQILTTTPIHGGINVEVHLCDRPEALFPLVHKYFPQASFRVLHMSYEVLPLVGEPQSIME